MDEEELFAREMGLVKPLSGSKTRVQTQKPDRKHQILRKLERGATTHVHHHQMMQSGIKRAETWLLRADGVASKDIKTLAKKNIAHELDLHGLTQDAAIKALASFISDALAHNIRHISIVHGKGNHSQGQSVLKDATYQWLEHGPFAGFILAVTPANQSKGGASNIQLRKQKS